MSEKRKLCRECKSEIFKEATTCPQCGKDPNEPSTFMSLLYAGIIVVSVYILLNLFLDDITDFIKNL